MLDFSDRTRTGISKLISRCALQIGLSDGQLRRELGAIRNQSMASFSEKIEGFEQARMTEPDSSYGNAVSRVPPNSASNRQTSGQGGWLPNRNNTSRGQGERDRRLALCGKCFRVAKADHMIPACTYPDSVKCNLCGAVGHVTPACGRRQVAQMAQHIPLSPSSPPASSSQQLVVDQMSTLTVHLLHGRLLLPLRLLSLLIHVPVCSICRQICRLPRCRCD